MNAEAKTHYRKAFNSPYLSSADIVGPTNLTIKHVRLEQDHTKRTKDLFNTAYFVEEFLRDGEKLKPMILNAHNSKVMKSICDSAFIDDWQNTLVTIYVDSSVKFGRDTVEGLRINPNQPRQTKPQLTPDMTNAWNNAKAAYQRDGNLNAVKERMDIAPEIETQLIQECA